MDQNTEIVIRQVINGFIVEERGDPMRASIQDEMVFQSASELHEFIAGYFSFTCDQDLLSDVERADNKGGGS